jgi:hypothetical protein
MGIKEALAQIVEKRREKKLQLKQMEEQVRMEKLVEEKQKSSNERELERFLKEKRENAIKKQLDAFRKERQKQMWRDNKILSGKMPSGKPTMLKNDRPILKEKNIFVNKNMFWKK